MPKSSVSQKISRLESQLGVRLLQRTTRRLSLTPQGRSMWSSAGRCWRWPAAPIWRWHGCARPLRPGADHRTGGHRHPAALPILAEFRALYPEVVLELTLCDEQLDLVGRVMIWRCGRHR